MGFQVGERILPESLQEELPATSATFATGFALGGVPTFVGTLPLTLPMALVAEGDEGFGILLAPAGAVGALTGGALALPVLPLELLVVRPLGGLIKGLRGRRYRPEPPDPHEQARRERRRRKALRAEAERTRELRRQQRQAKPEPARAREAALVQSPPSLELQAGPARSEVSGPPVEAGPVEWPAPGSPTACPTCQHLPCPACGHLPSEAPLPPWELHESR
ncbi:MAG TPA: hypothetical protein DEA08_17855 [Planctomycetes bacterium]|nr:hypothetical protein [Planctomycetota bacterium]